MTLKKIADIPASIQPEIPESEMAAGRFGGWASRFSNIPWTSISGNALRRILLVGKTFCGIHVINTYLVNMALLRGPSMLPTVSLTGDVVAVDRVSARRGSAGVGDIVILISPDDPRKVVAKRILGVGGDEVSFLVDPHRGSQSRTIVVPKGHVWVQGDNIYDSRDSRQFGSVPYGLIQGRIFFRVWPPKRFGFMEQTT